MNFKKTSLLILAGGKGSRIRKITKKNPKALIKFNKKPLLTLIINNLSKYNFKEIIILAGYKGIQIKKKYHNKIFNLIKVKCIIEKKRLGTWGAVHNYKKCIKNDFILVNGDTIFNAELNRLDELNFKKEKMVMFLTKNHTYKENKKLNNINIDKNNNNIFRNNNNIDENYIKNNKSISNLPNLEDKLIKNQDKLTKQYSSLSKLPKSQSIHQKK
jgi:NDP-sugar pyrophosphorylase family protein